MKRQDVKVGVIYARTGALAYGKEPNSDRPVRVRFLEPLVPHAWVWYYRVERETKVPSRNTQKLVEIKREIVPVEQVPQSAVRGQWASAIDAERQKLGAVVARRWTSPGLLLAETSRDGEEWTRGLVAPAEVHRTWEEQQEKDQRSAAESRARQVAGWPGRIAQLAEDLVITAKQKANYELTAELGQTSTSLRTESGRRLLDTYVAALIQEALAACGVELDLPRTPKKPD